MLYRDILLCIVLKFCLSNDPLWKLVLLLFCKSLYFSTQLVVESPGGCAHSVKLCFLQFSSEKESLIPIFFCYPWYYWFHFPSDLVICLKNRENQPTIMNMVYSSGLVDFMFLLLFPKTLRVSLYPLVAPVILLEK